MVIKSFNVCFGITRSDEDSGLSVIIPFPALDGKGGLSFSILELANEIKKMFNDKPHICIDNSGNREDDYIGKIGDTSETFSLLKWKPEFSLSNGLNHYIKWCSKN